MLHLQGLRPRSIRDSDLKPHRTPRLKYLGHAMNPIETFRAPYGLFGRSRSRILSDSSARNECLIRNCREEPLNTNSISSNLLDLIQLKGLVKVVLGSERQWLRVGDSHDYVLGSVMWEKSEEYEDAVARGFYEGSCTLKSKVLPRFPPPLQRSP